MASSINNSTWLEWMTGLMEEASRQTYSATFPPDLYYCPLDELPLHLVPRSAAYDRRGTIADLVLNPECKLCAPNELPPNLVDQNEQISAFSLQYPIAWVRDKRTNCLNPFWLSPKIESLIRHLEINQSIPESFPASARSILESAGILVSAASNGQPSVELALRKACELFQKRGYAPLHGLIHPFHIAALRRYYRRRIRTGTIPLGDGQSPRRHVAYNDPVARFFHHQIAPILSEVVGEPIKPSYVYLASYLSGAELKKHVDREQCEFSITLCLDFSPEPALATPWPISLDTPNGKVTVYQMLGDGLAYRGTRLPHYRSRLGEGQTSTSIFFHYVPASFTGSLD
jgi:hypothetical protein